MTQDIIDAIKDLQQDQDVSKRMKVKLDGAIHSLHADDAESLKLSRVMHDLEEIGDDNNLQPLTRTAVLSVLSLIESKANAMR